MKKNHNFHFLKEDYADFKKGEDKEIIISNTQKNEDVELYLSTIKT